jgi:sugar phosphate permease
LLANVMVWRIALTGGMLTFSQFAVVSFAGVFLGDARHVPHVVVPLLLAGMQVLGGAVRIGSGLWTDRRGGRSRCLRAIAVTAAVVLVLVALGGHGPAWIVAAGLCVTGILVSGWHGIVYVAVAEAGAPRSGTALGVLNTSAFIAGLGAPITVAPLLAHTSWAVVWVAAAVASGLAALAMPTVPDR